ncbi:hypothetical protein L0U85_13515 [Glycomyces sp. L485]|uniref:FitA-like ribbon-helix-helix domain-containing protein n=1 Tax=Glycomyces sp. L485 TaxID=2909235 RepID=UPI001F4A1BF0|nr:hypothetical protein [Glycomyces sp. L485]MCH7231864.1 hypothetical protein [Glycomyces sp. L485]
MSIRGIDPELYRWLKVRAAEHDRSMEAEARAIFAEAKHSEERRSRDDMSLGDLFRTLVADYGGLDGIELPSRNSPARAADFSEWDLPE